MCEAIEKVWQQGLFKCIMVHTAALIILTFKCPGLQLPLVQHRTTTHHLADMPCPAPCCCALLPMPLCSVLGSRMSELVL